MELEAPADGWYVWVAVSLVSLAILGLVFTLPSGPPPDATTGANTIDDVAGSPYEATGTFTHDGAELRLSATQLSLRGDHGTDHAPLSYGPVVPVAGDPSLERVVHGASYQDEFGDGVAPSSFAFLEAVDDAAVSDDGEWHGSSGAVTVRQVRLTSGGADLIEYVPGEGHRAITAYWDGVRYDSTAGEFYVVLVADGG